MKTTTNNVPRNMVYGYELSEKEWQKFDYVEEDGRPGRAFIRYKKHLYDVGDTMVVDEKSMPELYAAGWHAYESDTHFSGVLFKFTDDNEQVICATFYCSGQA